MEGTGPLGVVVVGLGDVGPPLITECSLARAPGAPVWQPREGGGTGDGSQRVSRLRDRPHSRSWPPVFRRLRGARRRCLPRRVAHRHRQIVRWWASSAGAAEDPGHAGCPAGRPRAGIWRMRWRKTCGASSRTITARAVSWSDAAWTAPIHRPSLASHRRRGARRARRERGLGHARIVYEQAAAEAGYSSWRRAGTRYLLAGIAALFEEKSLPVAGAGLLDPTRCCGRRSGGAGAGGAADRGRGLAVHARRGARGAALGWAGSHCGDGTGIRLGRGGVRAVHRAARARGPASRRSRAGRGAPGGSGAPGGPDRRAGLDGRIVRRALGQRDPREADALSLRERRALLLAELPALARGAGREAA